MAHFLGWKSKEKIFGSPRNLQLEGLNSKEERREEFSPIAVSCPILSQGAANMLLFSYLGGKGASASSSFHDIGRRNMKDLSTNLMESLVGPRRPRKDFVSRQLQFSTKLLSG